MHQTYQIHKL